MNLYKSFCVVEKELFTKAYLPNLFNRSFSLSRNEKINWKPSCGGSQEDEMLWKTNI